MVTQALSNIRNSISNSKTDLALKMLKRFLTENGANNDKLNFIIIQEANYNLLKKQQMLGSIDFYQYNMSMNKINGNILNLLDELEISNIDKTETQTLQPDKSIPKKARNFLIGVLLLLTILVSGFTKYSFFKLFNYNISNEKIKTDLLGRTVYFKNDSSWIFLSKDNFKEFYLLDEKIYGNINERIIRLKLEDMRNKNYYHMKLFLRYSYDFCEWKLDDDAVLEYYKIDK